MRNFDRFIGIDWTGAKSPIHSRAIAVSTIDRNQACPTLLNQIWSRQKVADYIESLIKTEKRILIGIDCNFGYARDILLDQLDQDSNAFDLWQKVNALNADQPNFFAGNFWMHPDYRHYFWTTGKMPKNFQMPRRLTETICGESGYGWPESPFKMIGAKQVGKGGLAGMRLAHYLKQNHGDEICIWPYDEPDKWDTAKIVITEIYPRQFIKRAGFGNKKLRTIDDLNAALNQLNSSPIQTQNISDHDTDAIIAAAGLKYLCGDGKNISEALANPPATRAELKCEGWIFGAGYK